MGLIVDFPESRSYSSLSSSIRSRVAFESDLEIKIVENLTVEYKQDLWFSGREMKSFRLNATKITRAKENMTMATYAERNIDDSSLFMGLESFLSQNITIEIQLRRQSHRKGVLEEQYQQACTGIHDPDRLMEVSQKLSAWARERSRIIARLHA